MPDLSEMTKPRTRLRLLAVVGLAVLITATQPIELGLPSLAVADDGGDGGGGGGDGGGPGWNPFARSRHKGSRSRVSRPRGPSELVVAGLSAADAERLVNSGFQVHDQFNSVLLGSPVARIIAPRGLTPRRALARVRMLVPSGTATRNDLFNRTRIKAHEPENGISCGTTCPHFGLTAWHSDLGRCTQNVSIGVIDTGVDVEHPSLKSARIEVRTTRRSDRAASDRDHGTGVVSLIAGSKGSEMVGLVQGDRKSVV